MPILLAALLTAAAWLTVAILGSVLLGRGIRLGEQRDRQR
jgi:hypothetical protein